MGINLNVRVWFVDPFGKYKVTQGWQKEDLNKKFFFTKSSFQCLGMLTSIGAVYLIAQHIIDTP